MKLDQIKNEALELAPNERAKLAKLLLLSLDLTGDSEAEDEWFTEALLRAEEIDSGKVELVNSDTVRKEALSLLK